MPGSRRWCRCVVQLQRVDDELEAVRFGGASAGMVGAPMRRLGWLQGVVHVGLRVGRKARRMAVAGRIGRCGAEALGYGAKGPVVVPRSPEPGRWQCRRVPSSGFPVRVLALASLIFGVTYVVYQRISGVSPRPQAAPANDHPADAPHPRAFRTGGMQPLRHPRWLRRRRAAALNRRSAPA